MSRRIAKINTLLRQEIAQLLLNDFADQYGIITILDINTSPDLQSARVYFSLTPPPPSNQLEELLRKVQNNARGYQNIFAKKFTLRYIPKLEFIYDTSQNNISRIDQILNEIKENEL